MLRKSDPLVPLSVGNGQFAFNVDVTGLQTFDGHHLPGTPLTTQSQWGWHSRPMPAGMKASDLKPKMFNAHGREVGYFTSGTDQKELFDFLRQNPHRLHLGRIALLLPDVNGAPCTVSDLTNIEQTLDLWTGIIVSTFNHPAGAVKVTTACTGERDGVAIRVESPLLTDGKLRVQIAFPYGTHAREAADWKNAAAHTTTVRKSANSAEIDRKLDGDAYFATLAWTDGATLNEPSSHTFTLTAPQGKNTLEFACLFAEDRHAEHLAIGESLFDASRKFWQTFWQSGGAIDLDGSTDPRAKEIERRIVLSQHLTRINCAGELPPQETGLTCNSWYGKFHLEMHWWHAAQFSQWGRHELLARSLGYYHRIQDVARGIAKRQGYAGARWPKMTDATGVDSPSPVGPLLIWQQPHPIYYAELCYRDQPNTETLKQWSTIVEETAEFMASYAFYDEATKRYVLGPPLLTVPENTTATTTMNPAFELAYWRFGLRTAQTWRERQGQTRNPEWDRVLSALATLPQFEDTYIQQEGMNETFTTMNYEHPGLIGPLGMQPGDGVDVETMKRTVQKVMKVWDWNKKTWGWDYPMVAMCAARCGFPEMAVDALLLDTEKNRWAANGHVYQREDLTLYLPANGGFLSAVAMMAAGWDNGPKEHAPGFPKTLGWVVRHEGLRPMI